jgi:hypothetical protein
MPKNIDICSSSSASFKGEDSQSESIKVDSDSGISLDGSLNLDDYIQDVTPTAKVAYDISIWAEKQREVTRTKLVTSLVTLLQCSLLGTFFLIGVTTFRPNANQSLVKDLAPQLITAQVTLVSVALGFYFNTKQR